MSAVLTPEKPQQSEASTSPPETEPSYLDLAEPIRAAHEAYTEGMRTTLEKGFEVGRLLTEAKGKVKHGYWETFVKEYCNFGISMAQNYMKCYGEREYLAKAQQNGPLATANLSSAIKLLEKRNSKNGDDKDNKDDTHDDTHDNHHDDDNNDDTHDDNEEPTEAESLLAAIDILFWQIERLEKDGIEIWTREELKSVIGRFDELGDKLAEIAECVGIVEAE